MFSHWGNFNHLLSLENYTGNLKWLPHTVNQFLFDNTEQLCNQICNTNFHWISYKINFGINSFNDCLQRLDTGVEWTKLNDELKLFQQLTVRPSAVCTPGASEARRSPADMDSLDSCPTCHLNLGQLHYGLTGGPVPSQKYSVFLDCISGSVWL